MHNENEYIFIGNFRPAKIKELFRLSEQNNDMVSFILPECHRNDFSKICTAYEHLINIMFFVDGITKEQADNEVDVFDKSLEKIKALSLKIMEQNNFIKGIIPSCEAAVYPAAVIRTFLGIDGLQAEHAMLFRDKCLMKAKIISHNTKSNHIHTPKYVALEETDHLFITTQMKEHCIKFPIILKPRAYGGSFGVHLIHNYDELQKLDLSTMNTQYELDEFIKHRVAHSNGVVDDGKVIFINNYYYNDSPMKCGCYGKFGIAHIEISDPNLNNKINAFAQEILSRLEMQRGVFHLEFFISDTDELIFLEVAARTPGAIIVPVIESSTNTNLQTVSCAIDMNRQDWKSFLNLDWMYKKISIMVNILRLWIMITR